jgi:voltage-gated potassium channel
MIHTTQVFTRRHFVRVLVVFTILIVSMGLIIVPIEMAQGNIKDIGDGMWWAASTASGVGYGDRYPVTTLGRLIGVSLMFVGVLAFGSIIGIIGDVMNKRQEDVFWAREFERFNLLEKKLEAVDKKLQYLVFEQAGHPVKGTPEEAQSNRE